jgi:predicted cobalt transporter CbtA
MTRTLLLRGMLTGILAGLLVFAFAHTLGEPQVDRAIAFESAMDEAQTNMSHGQAADPEPELVSRRIQKSLGLLTGVVLYGTAIGGLFGLIFAFAQGRIEIATPRTLAAFLATLGFLTTALVPDLKYPANPPAVGNPDTIGIRTAAYFLLIAFSIAATILSLQLRRRLTRAFGPWNASLTAIALYIAVIAVVFHFMPTIDEVPPTFPASLLWHFRIAALGIQLVLWTALGLLFGSLTERSLRPSR